MFHPSLDHAISIGNRLKEGLDRDSRPVTRQFLESHCIERDVSIFGESLKLKGLDHPLFRDFVEHAMKSKFISVLILMDIAIPAATARFERFQDHFISPRTEPLSI